MQPLAGHRHEGSWLVVGRVDDERIAFPIAARIPFPLLNRSGRVRPAIQFNGAGIVNHLRHDHHGRGCLHDLIVALVSLSQLRRAVCEAAFR